MGDASDNKGGCPYIYGQFTNWEPKRMFEIREFCDRINKDKPNVFERLKAYGLIRHKVETVDELNKTELAEYTK